MDIAMLRTILTFIQWASAFAIVGLVLLQRGKGAEAGAGFGAGASGTVFGARGAATALSKATAFAAAIFMINSLALAYTGKSAAEAQQKSILDEATAKKTLSLPAAGTPAPTAPPASSSPAPLSSVPPPSAPPSSAPAAAPVPAPAPAPTPAPAH
jgi:preprotein translocase subunit SecG